MPLIQGVMEAQSWKMLPEKVMIQLRSEGE